MSSKNILGKIQDFKFYNYGSSHFCIPGHKNTKDKIMRVRKKYQLMFKIQCCQGFTESELAWP